MCELIVGGSGFLWHQIRCIVALLILIGQGKEEVDLLKALLDIDKYPSTPNYQIASGQLRPCVHFSSLYLSIVQNSLWCSSIVNSTVFNGSVIRLHSA